MVQLSYGDKLRFACSFQHLGAAYSGAKLHAAIGNKRTVAFIDYFDEIVNNEVLVTGIVYDAVWQTYTVNVDVPITSAISGGSYETMVKLMSIPGGDVYWYGSLDDIVVVSGAAEFQNLSVNYQKV